MKKEGGRRARALKIVQYLKRAYPKPKSELLYETAFQFVVSVMLSAQCTDTVVNKVTESLFKKYKTPKDFARAKETQFQKEIARIPFFRNKTKAILATAKEIVSRYGGEIPRGETALQTFPGIGYKTAHVIVGELYNHWPGIPTDTHVKRFARKFDLTRHTDLTKISKDLEALIPKRDWKYINNGLVLYGRYVCSARIHDCSKHPLTQLWPKAGNRWPKVK